MTAGNEIAKLYASVGADVGDYKKGLGFVKSSLGDLSGQMGGVLKVVGGIGAALGGAFAAKEIIDGAKTLNKTLTNIQSLGGRTAEDMKKLQDTFLATGKNTILEGGTQSAAQAFYDIASGVSGADQQMAIFNAAIATAEAGQANLTATASGLVSVMNSYGLGVKDVTNVSDIFTRTVGLGVGSMDQFVAALAPIANLAATAGVSFQELATSAAFLTSKGATTGDAATELQSALVALLKPTDSMKEALAGLGYSAESLIKEFGLVGAIEKLKGTTDGSASSLTALFGRVEALKGVLAVTGKDFNKFSTSFTKGLKGATEAAREIQRNSPEAKMAKFGNQLNALGLQLGSAILPPLGDLAEILGKLIEQFGEITKPVKEFLGALAGPIIEKGRKAFTKFTDQWGDFTKNVQKFGLGDALKSALNLGGNGYESGWIQGVLESLGMDKGAAGQFVTTLKDVLLAGLEIFNTFRDGISDFTSDIKNFGIADAILGAFGLGKSGAAAGGESWVQGIFNSIASAVQQFMPQLSEIASNIVQGIGAFINENLPKLNDAFQTLLGGVGDWLGSDGPGKLATGLMDMVKGAADWLINTGWPEFRRGFESIVANIAAFFQGEGWMKFVSGLGTMFSNAYNWLTTEGMQQFVNGVIGIGKEIYNFFTGNGWIDFKNGLVKMFNDAAVWIVTVGVPQLGKAFTGLINEIGRILNLIPDMIRKSLSGQQASIPTSGPPLGFAGTHAYSLTAGSGKKVSGGRALTPFASGGFAPIGTNFIAGEGGVPEVGRVGAMGTTFKPLTNGAGAGGGGNKNVTIYVMDRDLRARLEDILEEELR